MKKNNRKIDIPIEWLPSLGQCHVRFMLMQKHNIPHQNSYDEKLFRAAKALLLWMQLGQLDESRLASIWSMIAGEDWDVRDVSFTKQATEHRKYVVRYYRRFLWFYNFLHEHQEQTKFRFEHIHRPFNAVLGNVNLIGSIDAITREQAKIPHTIWVLDNPYYAFKSWHLFRNPYIHACGYGGMHLLGKKGIRIQYVDLRNKKVHRILPKQEHIDHLAYLTRTVYEIMDQGLYYPIYNAQCKSCPVIIECERGDWIEDRIYRQAKWESAANRGRRNGDSSV